MEIISKLDINDDFIAALADAIVERMGTVTGEQLRAHVTIPAAKPEPEKPDPAATPVVTTATIDDIKDACNTVRDRLLGEGWRELRASDRATFDAQDAPIKEALRHLAQTTFRAADPTKIPEGERPRFIAMTRGIHREPDGRILPF